jgi:hypothetical protein
VFVVFFISSILAFVTMLIQNGKITRKQELPAERGKDEKTVKDNCRFCGGGSHDDGSGGNGECG